MTSQWHSVQLVSPRFRARAAHASVYVASTQSMYVFGGDDLNVFLNDFMQYDFGANQWTKVTELFDWPAARRHHAMAVIGNSVYMFGGELRGGRHSNELWMYNVITGVWRELASSSRIKPLPVASHTLTSVNDEYLYLYGGRTSSSEILATMYRINVTTTTTNEDDDLQWEEVLPAYGNSQLRALAGHTTVFHDVSQSLYVFGGFHPDDGRSVRLRSDLHVFNVKDNVWTTLFVDNSYIRDSLPMGADISQYFPPRARAYHTANIIGNYMVVFGGKTHRHGEVETCYDNGLYLYDLLCHVWVPVASVLSSGEQLRHSIVHVH